MSDPATSPLTGAARRDGQSLVGSVNYRSPTAARNRSSWRTRRSSKVVVLQSGFSPGGRITTHQCSDEPEGGGRFPGDAEAPAVSSRWERKRPAGGLVSDDFISGQRFANIAPNETW